MGLQSNPLNSAATTAEPQRGFNHNSLDIAASHIFTISPAEALSHLKDNLENFSEEATQEALVSLYRQLEVIEMEDPYAIAATLKNSMLIEPLIDLELVDEMNSDEDSFLLEKLQRLPIPSGEILKALLHGEHQSHEATLFFDIIARHELNPSSPI